RLQGDWSSDVCSSDLSIESVPKVVRVQLKCPCGCSLAKIALIKIHKGGVAMKVLRGIMFAALSLFSLLVVNTSGVQGAEPEPVKIGRASCRERGEMRE